jgi:hypothetical protein
VSTSICESTTFTCSSRVLDEPPVREAEQRVVGAVGAGARGELVAGDVFADERVERQVGVEGADEIVAVAPREGNFRVALAAVRLGVADEIHPVPRPMLAEARRCEEAIRQRGY